MKLDVYKRQHRRSVVSTASYEARKYGVNSAMPLMMALEKCPDLVVVQGDYSWYEELSKRFFQYLRKFTPFVEPASIDEAYMDVTEVKMCIRDRVPSAQVPWKNEK